MLTTKNTHSSHVFQRVAIESGVLLFTVGLFDGGGVIHNLLKSG